MLVFMFVYIFVNPRTVYATSPGACRLALAALLVAPLYAGVGKRACSASCREEFFSQTDFRHLRLSVQGALMRTVGAVLRSVLAGVAFIGPAAVYLLLFGGT